MKKKIINEAKKYLKKSVPRLDKLEIESILNFIFSALFQYERVIIKEFIAGERCYSCGKKMKKKKFSETCDECLENN